MVALQAEVSDGMAVVVVVAGVDVVRGIGTGGRVETSGKQGGARQGWMRQCRLGRAAPYLPLRRLFLAGACCIGFWMKLCSQLATEVDRGGI